MNEFRIRDLLVEQLDCLEPGLRFLNKEKYLPSNIGTKSFIDIVAQDANNNWVIIELKRSEATSRQAIHEVLKYVEAIKAHLGVRDDEIRTIIVSTVWTELLPSFSKLCSDTPLDLTGFSLDISNPKNLTSQKVVPLKSTAGRVLSPWHELNLYKDIKNLQRGLESYVEANKIKGISDYVIVVLEASSERHEIEYKYILYFVPQLLSKEACIDFLQRTNEDIEELLDTIEDMEEEEALRTLHGQLFSAAPKTYNERFEIGYPAKFHNRLIKKEGWSIISVNRYGSLARNQLLTDETIISEICGETGVSGQVFKRSISAASKSQLSTAREEISECLSVNPIWRVNILSHLKEIENDYPDSEVDISIFNPSTGLFTLYFTVMNEQGTSFLPEYSMAVDNNGEIPTIFFGALSAGENQRTFQEVIDKFYDGNIRGLLISATWGYRELRDYELLKFIGIQYRSYRCDIKDKEREFFVWSDNRWREIDPIDPFQSLASYFERERIFMTNLLTEVNLH